MGRRRRNVDERFDDFLVYAPPGECILWGGFVKPQAYGQFWDGERLVPAHVYSWARINGPVPQGKIICHSRECCSRACVYVGHLRADTYAANTLDMCVLGRSRNDGRLTDEHVLDLRAMYAEGAARSLIEAKYDGGPHYQSQELGVVGRCINPVGSVTSI